MVTLAMYTLNILHPGHLLGPAFTWTAAVPMDALGSNKGAGGVAYVREQPRSKQGAGYA